MEPDAAAVGVWENTLTGRKHPRLQILTLAELFQNKRPDIPLVDASAVKFAAVAWAPGLDGEFGAELLYTLPYRDT